MNPAWLLEIVVEPDKPACYFVSSPSSLHNVTFADELLLKEGSARSTLKVRQICEDDQNQESRKETKSITVCQLVENTVRFCTIDIG